jgi:hypothetical protein
LVRSLPLKRARRFLYGSRQKVSYEVAPAQIDYCN